MKKILIAATAALLLVLATLIVTLPDLRDALFSTDTPYATFQEADNSVCNTPGSGAGFGTNQNYWRPRGPLTGDLFLDGSIALFAYGLFMLLFVAAPAASRGSQFTYGGIGGAVMLLAGVLCITSFNGIQAGPPGPAVAQAQASQPQAQQPATTAKSGLLVYIENCVVCHDPAGKGTGPGGANLPTKPQDLTTYVREHDDRELTANIADGYSGSMPAFKTKLSPAEIQNVIQYIRKLSDDAQAGK
jgi:mono/diheme cytochrome c family protein